MNNLLVQIREHIDVVDGLTDKLLDIADILEDNIINVELENGRYLNPAGSLRGIADRITDEMGEIYRTCRHEVRTGEGHEFL